ncbi:hypothetical protein B0T16DRAFT_408568 [Cercophora newfieldiana]|uniref:Uncharacterized protein n=1 Tax=Cercophora newfieldiana TaxID=92897 RepID=A0AA39YCS0_9PEZI|nr:hypothetical protein B0T16DRAFT_408568 [Cercophora newfieldiana]
MKLHFLLISLATLSSVSASPSPLDTDAAKCECVTNCPRIVGMVCVPIPDSKPCRSVCVYKPAFCGGIAGIPCPEEKKQKCVDDPRDDCDPANGGSDCGGVCVPADA